MLEMQLLEIFLRLGNSILEAYTRNYKYIKKIISEMRK